MPNTHNADCNLGLIGGIFSLAVTGLVVHGALLLNGCTIMPADTPPAETASSSVPTQNVVGDGAPRRLVNPAPPPGAAANVPTLSQSDMESLIAQVKTCWTPAIGVLEAKDLTVTVRFALNRDGTLSGDPSVVNRGNTALFQLAAESAVSAVRRCQPFRLPTSKYQAWQVVEVAFASGGMVRR
jgi:hypothetical protein